MRASICCRKAQPGGPARGQGQGQVGTWALSTLGCYISFVGVSEQVALVLPRVKYTDCAKDCAAMCGGGPRGHM